LARRWGSDRSFSYRLSLTILCAPGQRAAACVPIIARLLVQIALARFAQGFRLMVSCFWGYQRPSFWKARLTWVQLSYHAYKHTRTENGQMGHPQRCECDGSQRPRRKRLEAGGNQQRAGTGSGTTSQYGLTLRS
jgi:hypothetical protein